MNYAFELLIKRWRDEAAVLRRYASEAQADVVERLARELEAALKESELEELTLEQAQSETGFAYSTLQRMVAEGRIPNAGDRHKPRIRRRDLPKKPAHRERRLEVHRAHAIHAEVSGEHRRSLKHSDREAAVAWAKKVTAEMQLGDSSETDPIPTVSRVFALYAAFATPAKGRWRQKHDQRCTKLWTRLLGAQKDLRKLNRHEWEAFTRDRKRSEEWRYRWLRAAYPTESMSARQGPTGRGRRRVVEDGAPLGRILDE